MIASILQSSKAQYNVYVSISYMLYIVCTVVCRILYLHHKEQIKNNVCTATISFPLATDSLTAPHKTVILKSVKRHCPQTVSPLRKSYQEMTALLVRERRPFRIYSEYVEQNCCAYKETQKFLAHAQHPLYKGVTNRLLSGTVPCYEYNKIRHQRQ